MTDKTLHAEELKYRVYRFVCDYYRARGISPMYAEMLAHCHIASRGHLNHIIQKLVEEGRLEFVTSKYHWRNLRPTDHDRYDRARRVTLPYLGAIAANTQNPLELLDVIEDSVDVSAILLPAGVDRSRCYVLEVNGDSMADANILDGDKVVLEQRDAYNPGEIVAFYLKDVRAVTLKRLLPGRDGTVLLNAESHKHFTRVEDAENVIAMGRVVALMRTMP